jgi:hypothetical protein
MGLGDFFGVPETNVFDTVIKSLFLRVSRVGILRNLPQESFKTSPIGGMRRASQPFMLGGVVQRGGADHLAPLWWKEEYS